MTLLVMTTGQSDVQLVANDQRHKLNGDTCGTLHDEIGARRWSVCAVPDARSRDVINELPAGDLKLCTPKLDAVLAHFGDAVPASALIFETNRRDARDPRMCGAIMERRLRDRGVSQVTRVPFLTGNEQLEDPRNDVDAVVRQAVVARLSRAISEATANLVTGDHVFVATTGGIPAANEVINELVRLHAVGGPSVTALEVPDGNRLKNADRAVEEKFHPAAGYRARWHALSLVEKGNLLGAWGSVCHLEGAPGQEWTRVIRWLAHFASSLPLADSSLALLSHPRMAVRAALRVELALRAGDIPRAIHGTVAFFEAALWDRLGERLERSPDAKKRRSFRFRSGHAPTDKKLLRRDRDDRQCPFEWKEKIDGVDWYWVFDGDGGPARRLAQHFLESDSLPKLDLAISREIHGSKIRELRNDIAHDEPTPDLMKEARSRMQAASLWSNTDTFLSQPLVQDVLKELGEPAPETLLADLLSEVRRRMVVVRAEGTT